MGTPNTSEGKCLIFLQYWEFGAGLSVDHALSVFDPGVKCDPVIFSRDAPVHDGRVETSERRLLSRDRRELKRFGGFGDSPAASTPSPAERNAHFTPVTARLLKRKVRSCDL